MRLGILGGTFNPPHLGHLVCAQEAYVHLRLDRVMLVPAREPPHKNVEDEPGVEYRLALCRLAVADDERFVVGDLDATRPGPSYTVDTLERLQSRVPDSELFLILGADVAATLPRWRQPERILSLATLAIAERPGTARAEVEGALARVRGGERSAFFPMPTIGVSSTIVRERVRARQPLRYVVPGAVASYIDQHGLYGGGSAR